MRIIFYTFILCSLIIADSFSRDKLKTNLEVIDDIVSSGFEKFLYYPDINRNEQFIFVINSKDSAKDKDVEQVRYLRSIIKKLANSEKLKFSLLDNENNVKSDSAYYLFIVQPEILQTKYNGFVKNRFLGGKTVDRNIKVKISVDISSRDSLLKISDNISKDYRDEVNLDDLEKVQSDQYGFTHAEPPEIGVFESAFFPAILIAASGGATLLFFIIRTK